MSCNVQYTPPPADDLIVEHYDVLVSCGPIKNKLRLLTKEANVEIRVYTDHSESFIEGYF